MRPDVLGRLLERVPVHSGIDLGDRPCRMTQERGYEQLRYSKPRPDRTEGPPEVVDRHVRNIHPFGHRLLQLGSSHMGLDPIEHLSQVHQRTPRPVAREHPVGPQRARQCLQDTSGLRAEVDDADPSLPPSLVP